MTMNKLSLASNSARIKPMKKFYITSTLPYVNADPHLGFALEIVQADTIARYHRMLNDDVVFNTGTDEHGLKIYRKALEEGKEPKTYVDQHVVKFEKLRKTLNLSYTNFIRTTNPHHIEAAREFWKRCDKNGDIYKTKYKIKYCVGCELEKTDSELENGCCPIHPNLKLEIIEEENYFFKFSKYQKPLLEFYEKNLKFVVPDFRFNEIKQFVKSGLTDFSISRLKEKMPWGVPVPNDKDHVMYVWFDALVNYISTLGWPKDVKKFEEFWGTKEKLNAIQTAGKDNLRQQSAMWQAMLMSADLPNSKQILIHGFVTNNGHKMSKSLGNVINPLDIVEKYGVDALRYYLLKEIPPTSDGDFSEKRLKEVYNADLANGLGNLVSRVAKLCEKNEIRHSSKPKAHPESDPGQAGITAFKHLENFQFNLALEETWKEIKSLDVKINADKPWSLSKEAAEPKLKEYVQQITNIGETLKPFLPETAEKIKKQFKGPVIKSKAPLFPRI